MNIGIAIKSIRRQVGITQHELADRCGISQTSLSQIENCVKRPSHRTIKSICTVLDVPESRKGVYDMLFPSIRSMALQIVSAEHRQYIQPLNMAV